MNAISFLDGEMEESGTRPGTRVDGAGGYRIKPILPNKSVVSRNVGLTRATRVVNYVTPEEVRQIESAALGSPRKGERDGLLVRVLFHPDHGQLNTLVFLQAPDDEETMKLLAMVVAKRPGAQGDCRGASLIFQMPPSP